jgi:DNA repair exonuclease SbcCD ATPase subunit
MQMKNMRGVQQEEVSEAADALLASGLRPTIERVRQHLGRGSPNTVSPMLETWFAGLGKRLGMAEGGAEEGVMPAGVLKAMSRIWETALFAARKEVEAALAPQMQAIETGNALLSDRESKLAQQEQTFIQHEEMLEKLLQAERDKTEAAEDRLALAKEELDMRDYRASELRATLAATQDQLQNARSHNDELVRSHADERTKWEERAAGNERRLLGEIDRERQGAKEAKAATEEATRQLQAIRSDMENRTMDLGQKLHVSEMELANARHALALSEQRHTELTGQLQEQRSAHAAVHEQLNQALAAMARATTTSKRKATAGRGAAK